MEMLVVNGVRLAFVDAGRGAPLVLIHGSLGDLRSFDQQVGPFAAHYRTIVPSLRHCWPERWDGVGDDFTVETHAADVAALIASRDAAPAHVLGHSRGGAVAIELALRHPELVGSLVLADPGGLEALLPATVEGAAMAEESARMFDRLREDLAAGDPVDAARRFAEALGGAGAWERRTEAQRRMLLDNIATGPHCAQRPRFTRAELGELSAPLLLVTGARSPARYRPMLDALRTCNERVKGLVTIEGAAHAMHREQPAAFNAAVLRFLASV